MRSRTASAALTVERDMPVANLIGMVADGMTVD